MMTHPSYRECVLDIVVYDMRDTLLGWETDVVFDHRSVEGKRRMQFRVSCGLEAVDWIIDLDQQHVSSRAATY
jgi:hypothetical protein